MCTPIMLTWLLKFSFIHYKVLIQADTLKVIELSFKLVQFR